MGSFRPPNGDWTPYLGRKISIRYRLHGDPAYPFSEAIGVVASVAGAGRDGGRLGIVTRKGERVEIAPADIIALKEFG